MINKIKATVLGLVVLALVGCETDASIASRNVSNAAEMFEVQRRIVFYNGITGEYMLTVEGRCSLEDDHKGQLEVICKVSDTQFKKHFLGLSDNVTYFAEQLDSLDVSVYHTRIIWKPQSIIPNIDLYGSMDDLTTTLTK